MSSVQYKVTVKVFLSIIHHISFPSFIYFYDGVNAQKSASLTHIIKTSMAPFSSERGFGWCTRCWKWRKRWKVLIHPTYSFRETVWKGTWKGVMRRQDKLLIYKQPPKTNMVTNELWWHHVLGRKKKSIGVSTLTTQEAAAVAGTEKNSSRQRHKVTLARNIRTYVSEKKIVCEMRAKTWQRFRTTQPNFQAMDIRRRSDKKVCAWYFTTPIIPFLPSLTHSLSTHVEWRKIRKVQEQEEKQSRGKTFSQYTLI